MKKDKKIKKDTPKNENEPEGKVLYMPIFMSIGVGVGMAIGSATNNIPIGMSIGLSCGMCLGISLDRLNRNKDEEAKSKEEPKDSEENE